MTETVATQEAERPERKRLLPEVDRRPQADRLLEMIGKLNAEQASLVRQKLGLDGVVKTRKSKRRTADARTFVKQYGECVMKDPDFEPVPSEAVNAKGPRAVEAFLQRWRDGESRLSNMELEELAETAVL